MLPVSEPALSASQVRERLRQLGLDLAITPAPGYYIHWQGHSDIGWQEPNLYRALHTGYALYLSRVEHPWSYGKELWS